MNQEDWQQVADAVTEPFWKAACERRFVLQSCGNCHRTQFPPRLHCASCQSSDLVWSEATGVATLYAVTTVRSPQLAAWPPPYQVGIVELVEGPRLLSEIVGGAEIGDRLTLGWRERTGLPPLPIFVREAPVSSGTAGSEAQ